MTLTINCESKNPNTSRSEIAAAFGALQSNVQVVNSPEADNGRTFVVYFSKVPDNDIFPLMAKFCSVYDQDCVAWYFGSIDEKKSFGGFAGPRPYAQFDESKFHKWNAVPEHMRGGFLQNVRE